MSGFVLALCVVLLLLLLMVDLPFTDVSRDYSTYDVQLTVRKQIQNYTCNAANDRLENDPLLISAMWLSIIKIQQHLIELLAEDA